jgi:hypothetical protein
MLVLYMISKRQVLDDNPADFFHRALACDAVIVGRRYSGYEMDHAFATVRPIIPFMHTRSLPFTADLKVKQATSNE